MKRVLVLWFLAASGLMLAFAPTLQADVAPSPERIQRRLERMREQAAAAAANSARPARSARPTPSGGPADSASSPSPAPSGSSLSALRDELGRKWAELAATRRDRRDRHRAELTRELGANLDNPAVMAEVKLHATHVADLARATFLAQNARTGAQRDKILERIRALSTREAARHQKQMAALLSAAAPPARSGTPAAPSATSPAAPAASAGNPP